MSWLIHYSTSDNIRAECHREPGTHHDAEGVETHRQRDLLTRIRRPLPQGYLFGRSMDAEGISAPLRDGSRERDSPMLHVLEA